MNRPQRPVIPPGPGRDPLAPQPVPHDPRYNIDDSVSAGDVLDAVGKGLQETAKALDKNDPCDTCGPGQYCEGCPPGPHLHRTTNSAPVNKDREMIKSAFFIAGFLYLFKRVFD